MNVPVGTLDFISSLQNRPPSTLKFVSSYRPSKICCNGLYMLLGQPTFIVTKGTFYQITRSISYVVLLLRHDKRPFVATNSFVTSNPSFVATKQLCNSTSYFLQFSYLFAWFSFKICKTHSNEGLVHSLEILV